MAKKIITLGNQKGGVSKTTSTASLAFLLSLKGFKVLAIDMDSQGNLGEILTLQDSDAFTGKTVFEAIREGDAKPFISKVDDNLDLLPAAASLARLPEWLYTSGNLPEGIRPQEALKRALSSVVDLYDYIVIDTPPALGDHLINALVASTDAIALVETSRFSVRALSRFLVTVEEVQNGPNPDLRICGILASLMDGRRSDNQMILLKLKMDYEGILFSSAIKRIAASGRLSILGFSDANPELDAGVKQYIPFVREVIER